MLIALAAPIWVQVAPAIRSAVMFTVIAEEVFPFLRRLGGEGSTYSDHISTYSDHMKDARFTISIPALLTKVVDMLDDVPLHDRDTNGDLYEYMLGKIAAAGRHHARHPPVLTTPDMTC